jgi:hypothetical protein
MNLGVARTAAAAYLGVVLKWVQVVKRGEARRPLSRFALNDLVAATRPGRDELCDGQWHGVLMPGTAASHWPKPQRCSLPAPHQRHSMKCSLAARTSLIADAISCMNPRRHPASRKFQ